MQLLRFQRRVCGNRLDRALVCLVEQKQDHHLRGPSERASKELTGKRGEDEDAHVIDELDR